jgi:hypothetical protein
MDMQNVNWLAVAAATVSSFLLGGLWYSPALFGRTWMAANGFSEADLQRRNMGKVFGLAFLFSLVMAVNLAMFLADPATTASWGATAGFLAGFGWIAMGVAVIAMFEGRPVSYILVNGGYMTVALVVMGLIIGAWR